jgi:hypothetical protein
MQAHLRSLLLDLQQTFLLFALGSGQSELIFVRRPLYSLRTLDSFVLNSRCKLIDQLTFRFETRGENRPFRLFGLCPFTRKKLKPRFFRKPCGMLFSQPRFLCRAFARALYRLLVEACLDCQFFDSQLTLPL